MVAFIRSDLEFILEQIRIAERQAAGASLIDILPNVEVPFGLRTIDGSLNNLVINQGEFGAADNVFPRLTDPVFNPAENVSVDLDGPGPLTVGDPTSYQQTSGFVFDSQPRTISNLVVDQTANNPAAYANAFDPGLDGILHTADDVLKDGVQIVTSPGLDGQFGTADDKDVFFFPNVTPDVGLTAPFNGWMTFFGQFFDHGLDLVTKGGSGTIFIPLQPDDPLFVPGSPTNFMVLTRATNLPGPDGILGTADDIHEQTNTTSPFVDQNQTYSSHPSHQVFLRGYAFNAAGDPVATGKLITNRDLGLDGQFGTADDLEIGGMATWKVVKAQARDILGINLTDADFDNVPLLATDAYGNFIKGPNGFPQVVIRTGNGPDGIAGTDDDTTILVEGNPASPVDLANAVRTGHAFLNDIAHAAVPVFNAGGGADGIPRTADDLAPDADTAIGNAPPAGTYDNELLDAHYIAGDGRVNENIGLTTVHAMFHSEHNRLVEHTKDVALADAQELLAGGATQAEAVAFLNNWLSVPITDLTGVTKENLTWNGERLFQAAKFGTEMQYQHLVFEEFARTVQPQVDGFLAPNGYDTTINPAIVAEFAHTVYRFGHSMLTETVDRFDPSFNIVDDPNSPGTQQLGLIAAFLNPLAFAASGPTPEEASGAIIRGLTRTVGNEIDEFVTEALRNNLVGLPLDLPAINLARGRDAGIPSLNESRREFYAMTGDGQLKPYTSWVDLVDHLKHPESLINFIAAYGTHSELTAADVDTLVEKRAVATALVLGGSAVINAGAADERTFTAVDADRLDFLNSAGTYASPASGVTTTGVDAIDLWIGGLAEEQMPFGGLLGSTFNFVFETQLENLQNGDRFYYLSRTAGMHFGTELENNSFAKLVMLNSDATHLPNKIFTTPTWTLEVDPTQQFTGLGPDGRADPTGGIMIGDVEITPLVIRDNPATVGPDTNYLQYTGEDHVVLGGTAGNDILIAGDGDDTIYGDAGNDRLEGGAGNDAVLGGAGDDIISDSFGDNRLEGGEGNDVIVVGSMMVGGVGNLILGGAGQDFIITTEDITTTFGGTGDDFILGAKTNLPPTGNEGDDWIEFGTQDGAPGDNFNPALADNIIGNDIFIGGGGFDEMIGEGGDDIFVGSDAQDKMDGMSGFDWMTYKNDRFGVTADLTVPILAAPHGETPNSNLGTFGPVGASPASIADRFAEVEGLSGSRFGDILRGDNVDAVTILNHGGATGGALTNVALIDGLQALLGAGATGFATGNIILGGDGSDIIEGRGGDDLIDGDKWLNVRIEVHALNDGTGPVIATFDSMVDMIPLMLDGTYNPGQLKAVREIMDGTANLPGRADNFDTAVFSGVRADYAIAINNNGTPLNFSDDIVTVTDNSARPQDGTDTLKHIERLQFADQSVVLAPGLNAETAGLLTINDAGTNTADNTPTTGQLLRASIAGVTDADNVSPTNPTGAITTPASYTWQVERVAGSGIFEDIIGGGGRLGFQSADGTTFRATPDLAGLSLRVKAIYQDAHGVSEMAFSAPTAAVAAGVFVPPAVPSPGVDTVAGGAGIHMVRSDLNFILDQIKIAEAEAAGHDLLSLIPNVRLPYGLRTVDGSLNNLVPNQSEFGAADNVFPRLTDPVFNTAEAPPPGFGPPGLTSYQQTSGLVFDSQPRTISNLVVDQTANNPAAYATAFDPGADGVLHTADDVLKDGVQIVTSPGLDGQFGTIDDKDVFFFPNVTPDAGLSAPFNAWMTFFGQFFDHGLDLVTKGGSGTIFIPLQPDDPLFVPGSPTNFMVLTRATNLPGPDGILGTADDIHEQTNTTSPFVDQNQTYSSHPSHQVFLRAYVLNAAGDPVATGKLITNINLGADGHFGGTGADADTEIGGMATWKVVKAQARDILGINLTDADFDNVPLLATDAYGNFIKGPNGFPQVVMKGADGIAGTSDDFLVEGNPASPVDLTNAARTGHAFLNDIAHAAVPVFVAGVLAPDSDSAVGLSEPGTYDNELLDAHYIAGDGRVNENIGLTTVHSIFHHEHNRLVEQTMDTVLASNDLAFLNEWLMPDAQLTAFPTPAEFDALQWNGERLFQAAKFGTEMQYQHLVFEEFARTIQPNVDLFFAPTQVYDADLDASIVAEFAHTVYRFGHSMLTETVDRFDPNFNIVDDPNSPGTQQLGLIAAFLNPLAFAASGPTPEEASGAIIRGLTRTVGNEIDEFVTEALRNNLVGLPLDLPAINLARGRDAGIPSLNAVRRDIYQQTGDGQLKPYTSWADLIQHLKHPESLINFIAAYGTHAELLKADVDTMAEKRAVATALVLGGIAVINAGAADERTFTAEDVDRLAFLNSTGTYASLASGVTTTGVDAIDLWIGGLAEEKTPFGGMLGSTFNFVFENQLEKLQDGDRFYYLERTAGLAFNAELEGNSFAKLIMANTDATHLPALVFSTPAFTLEVDPTKQFTGLGPDGRADPTGADPLVPLVIRDNPDTIGPDTNYLKYTGEDHVVLGGTAGNDIIISSIGDDTIWGDAGDDRIDGGYGNDNIRGGAGDDIITDLGGDDNIQGGDGNDVIHGGNGVNLLIGGFGSDFIITGEDASEAIGGQGNDFILGSKANEQDMGNEGDDWIEKGTSDGAPGDNFDPLGLDPIIGNDVFIGDGENDKFNAEGGDDIMLSKVGFGDRLIGGSGFDWADFKLNSSGVYIDISDRFFDQPVMPGSATPLIRFDAVEGLSGSANADFLSGDDFITFAAAGATGSVLTNFDLIDGLRDLLGTRITTPAPGTGVPFFDGGNIILGGAGSDIIEGRGGDDVIDGDAWLNVRISVRQEIDGTGPEIATFDSMTDMVPFMLDGTYNPGQLKIVREILFASGPDFDTAKFSGNLSDYLIDQLVNGDLIVTDLVGTDGIDTLKHIERLQFADVSVVFPENFGLNNEPLGAPAILDAASNAADPSPSAGQLLRASIAGVTDDDNPGGAITGPVSYFWQSELQPGVFSDIQTFGAGEVERVHGSTFTPGVDELGLSLRVRAVYKDAHGVLEEVFSAPTAPVGINTAPAGSDSTITASEDVARVFTASDFGFSDADGNALLAVRITTLPGAGTLTNNNVAVNAGDFIPVAAITGGLLKFTPAANASGTGYASFTFQVQDSGGASAGGVDLDPTPNTITVDVSAVNDAPAGTDATVVTNADTTFTFTAANFGFSDPVENNAFNAVRITTLPGAGTLTNNNVAMNAGDFVSVAAINAGLLKFAGGASGAGSASFTFQVQDNGGTANGGVDLDPTPNTITIDIAGVNAAPAGTDATVATNEDTARTFTAADFGFSDPVENNAFNAVKITTLPGAGSLTNNNVAVNAGDFVSIAAINAGLLKFTPAANASGAGSASFTFQVQDNGGTANGGVDLDPTPNTITVDVIAVNDAPAGADNTVVTNQNTAFTFTAADFGFTDPLDSNALGAVRITTLPGAGALTSNNVAVNAGDFVSIAAINAGLLKFTPAVDASGAGYASLTFQVQDNGGTANGGVDLDQSPNTITVNVTPVGGINTPLVLDVQHDFNGDGRSDLQWQNADGTPAVWLMNGLSLVAGANVGFNPGAAWVEKDSGDFNGDGKADILWQNADGTPAVWLMNGLSVLSGANVGFNPGAAWHEIAAADFNGDGKDDILWQNDSGQAAVWQMDGLNVTAGTNVGFNPGAAWHTIGAGDFDGDGKADILWQNDSGQAAVWLMDGFTVKSGSDVGFNPGSAWHVQGAGDFNGDGKADILWQNADGTPAVWLMDGTNLLAGSNVGFNPGPAWQIHDTGDFNGDGKADIEWQNTDGTPAVWLMDGFNILSGSNVGFNPGAAWHEIPEHHNLL
jgi:Ca2+-binding RTX toxin-like protein